MTKTNWIFSIILSAILFVGCGGDSTTEESQPKKKKKIPKGMIEYDITSKGFPLTVVIPDTINQEMEIVVQDWGETHVKVGKFFQLQIAEGGDMQLRKSDLAEDLLYKAAYIIEEDSAILYKQEIEGGNVQPAFHFYMVKNIGGIQYEIQDVNGEEMYPEKAAQKMMDAAKLISASKPNS